MNKLTRTGQIMFAIGIIGLGINCIVMKDFVAGRPPVSSWAAGIPGKLAWAYISGIIMMLAGLAVIINKKAGLAALLVGIMILVCSYLLRHIYEMGPDWLNSFKALALSGGAFIVAASSFSSGKMNNTRLSANNHLILTGCIFLSLFMIICGFAHLKFFQFVKDFIPAYIPFHTFWTYLTATCLLAGGIGILFNLTRPWAALLGGIMITGWFLLLHIPRFIDTYNNLTMDNVTKASDRMGICEAFTLAGVLFVLSGISRKEVVTRLESVR